MPSFIDDNVDLDIGGWNEALQNDSTATTVLWRQDPFESLSDWKIIVENEDNASPMHNSPTTYNTHKCYLALGKRRSEYFATQFRLPLKTDENFKSQTILKLPSLCIPCFPTFLDFVYDGSLDINKDKVVPLMEIARRLQNASLGQKAVAWARKNLRKNIDNCALSIFAHSIELNVDKLKDASLRVLAANFQSIPKDYLSEVPQDVLLELIDMAQYHLLSSVAKEYRFTHCGGGVNLNRSSKWATTTFDESYQYAIAEPAIVGPIGYWKLNITSLKNNHWVYVGTIANTRPEYKSCNDPTSYGWSSSKVYSKGNKSPLACQEWVNAVAPRFSQGDVVIMKLDMGKNKLTMKHERHQRSFEIDIETSSLSDNQSWYINITLYGKNDSCLLQRATEEDFEEFQF